jgi:hypothetical protein
MFLHHSYVFLWCAEVPNWSENWLVGTHSSQWTDGLSMDWWPKNTVSALNGLMA